MKKNSKKLVEYTLIKYKELYENNEVYLAMSEMDNERWATKCEMETFLKCEFVKIKNYKVIWINKKHKLSRYEKFYKLCKSGKLFWINERLYKLK